MEDFNSLKKEWEKMDSIEYDDHRYYVDTIYPLQQKIKELKLELVSAYKNPKGDYNYLDFRKSRFFICNELRKKGLTIRQISEKLESSYQVIYKILIYDGRPSMLRSQKEAVLVRDKRKCRVCGSVGRLHVHHIKTKSHRKSNLMTVCPPCHKSLDTYRRKNIKDYVPYAQFFIKENEQKKT